MHLLKRLASSIPALILISSIAFFLSKVMPGTSGDFILADDRIIGTQVQTDLRENIHEEYLHRTGQDKPLFYFRIASLVEPDTLYKIYPESHQKFLKKLCFAHGDWPSIADYYQSLKSFQKTLKSSNTGNENLIKSLRVQTLSLFDAVSALQTKKTLNLLEKAVDQPFLEKEIKISFQKVQKAFEQLQNNKVPYRKFVPMIYWNGFENQYHSWLSGLLKGDMGHSLRDNRSVTHIIAEALGLTLLMTICSLSLGWMLALLLGLVINLPAFQKGGKIILNSLYLLDTLPLFLLSLLLLLLLSDGNFLGLLPAFGLGNYAAADSLALGTWILLQHLLLPILCMTLAILPYLTGQVDRALKEVQKQEYVKTAKAKGLSDLNILKSHVLRNAWIPLISIFTDHLPAIISGALVVEVIFAIPGMGRLLASAINARDYPVILGITIIIATIKILANILADILYGWADPRIKFKFKG